MSKAKTYCKAYGIPLIIAFYLLLLAEAPIKIIVLIVLMCADAEFAYFSMLNNGATPEEARSVLPNSLKTEVICTANLREWRHILSLRADKRAHPQMRELMIPLLHELQEKIPVVFDDVAERIKNQNETDL